jgi:hypothetical protein
MLEAKFERKTATHLLQAMPQGQVLPVNCVTSNDALRLFFKVMFLKMGPGYI